jgi:glucose-1-phosphate cytidylyltransferase
MKVVILAGGHGTRLSEETHLKPKPMVEIGNYPILWHIMKIYSSYGFNEFVILLGYKGYVIKEYFSNYFLHQSDVTIDLKSNDMTIHQNSGEPWKVTLIDTGLNTMTGGRIKRAESYLGKDPFFMTYGDGVSDVNIGQLLKYHNSQKSIVTLTAVQPSGRYGSLSISDGKVSNFVEKPAGDNLWINGGFFVCQPEIFDYLENDLTVFEESPLSNLSNNGQLSAMKHHGYWQCMDTLRDKDILTRMWIENEAPWRNWD